MSVVRKVCVSIGVGVTPERQQAPVLASTGCVRPSMAKMAGSEFEGRPLGADVKSGAAAAIAVFGEGPAEKKLQRRSACAWERGEASGRSKEIGADREGREQL